jgi:hypothetical protein
MHKECAMRENLAVYQGHSQSEAHNRGSSPSAGRYDDIQFSDNIIQFPSDILAPLHGATIAATLAMHEACAQHWGNLNQYCSCAFWMARPFYLYPFEVMQQYFSFILGYRQCATEPVGNQRRTQRDLRPEPRHPSSKLDSGPQLYEETSPEEAMDVAIGACTEMWFEIIQEGASETEEIAAGMAA